MMVITMSTVVDVALHPRVPVLLKFFYYEGDHHMNMIVTFDHHMYYDRYI